MSGANIERREIFRAIGELAYVVAKSDRGLTPAERQVFFQIAQEELDYDSWAAQSRFELLDEVIQPSIDRAYNDALHELRKYSAYLTEDIKEKVMTVLQRVAVCCEGLSANETFVLDRVRKDLQSLG
ncbi:hypothetical protein WBG78_18555 [Chryseolinea sp. T2]|uniref:hypothetical protein n=1 Tax=Chryseolinea sp. T2 TaxID=3129255 RepID=UPI00307857FA